MAVRTSGLDRLFVILIIFVVLIDAVEVRIEIGIFLSEPVVKILRVIRRKGFPKNRTKAQLDILRDLDLGRMLF